MLPLLLLLLLPLSACVRRYLLQPRGKGLDSVLKGARPLITHALDLTVAYEGFSAECERNARQPNLLDGVVRDLTVHILIRRVALPDESEDTTAWLQSLYAEKEGHLSRWEHDGSFEAERIELPLPFRPLLAAFVTYAATMLLCASGVVLVGIELFHFVSD